MTSEIKTLEQVLLFLVNGGAGVAIWWLLEHGPAPIKTWWANIAEPDLKRWLVMAMTAFVAVLAYVGAALLGYAPIPGPGWQSWLIALLNIAIASTGGFTTSSLLHTRTLRANYERAQALLRAGKVTGGCCGGIDCHDH